MRVLAIVIIALLLNGCGAGLIAEYVVKERVQYYQALHDAR